MSSYWSKRRRHLSEFNSHLNNITQRSECHVELDGSVSRPTSTINSDNGKTEHPHHVPATSLLHHNTIPDINFSLSNESTQEDDLIDDIDDIDDFDNGKLDYESDCSDDLNDEYDESELISLVRTWSVENKITHAALRQLLRILHPILPCLPLDPRTLLNTNKNIGNIKKIGSGSYYHFGIETNVISLIQKDVHLQKIHSLHLNVNIDGLPIFKSSKTQLWPILGIATESYEKKPFVIGIFSGTSKPSCVDLFLEDFVQEMKKLIDNGIVCGGCRYSISINCFVCDAPARSYVKCCKSHNGHSACEKCIEPGNYENRRMSFPSTVAPLRTDVSFAEMIDEDHHLGHSPLSHLKISMVSAFPLEYMHLVCLGVMRKLIMLWLKGPLTCRIDGRRKNEISGVLLSLKSYIPMEFARKPRSLSEVDRWKATEFRLFLLYTGIIALKKNIADAVYQNFVLFFVAIHILVSPVLCLDKEHADYANSLLVAFVKHFSELYGETFVSYNVHSLIHLREDVKKFGPLDSFSAFPFENYLGKLKKMVRKPNCVLEQVIRRLTEQFNLVSGPSDECLSFEAPILKKEHEEGPLVNSLEIGTYSQYRLMHLNGFSITTKTGDNCVKIGSDIGLIKNIVSKKEKIFVIYQVFSKVGSLFDYPLNSQTLDIHLVWDLSNHLSVSSVENIVKKYVLLPDGENFAVLPLRHIY